MLTEYNGSIFAAEAEGDQVHLRTRTPTRGFQRRRNWHGADYYEKTVPMAETDGLFTATFLTYADNRVLFINGVRNGYVDVTCRDQKYAETHGFSGHQRGTWKSTRPADSFDTFQLVQSFENSSIEKVTKIDRRQLPDLWRKYVGEVAN